MTMIFQRPEVIYALIDEVTDEVYFASTNIDEVRSEKENFEGAKTTRIVSYKAISAKEDLITYQLQTSYQLLKL